MHIEKSSCQKAIVVDWDGTICDSIPNAFVATCSVFTKHNVPIPTFQAYLWGMRAPFINFYRNGGIHETVPEQEIWAQYTRAAMHSTNKLFPDAVPTLAALRMRGCLIALVSGQEPDVIEGLCKTHGCGHLFNHVFTTSDPPLTKAELFRKACRLMSIEDRAGIHAVGDVAADMEAALEAGMIPVGIVRDYNNGTTGIIETVLKEAGAQRIIHSLTELL